MSRFFVEPNDVKEDLIMLNNKDDIHHLKKVLRAKVGDEVDVSDSNHWEYRCAIKKLDDDQVEFKIIDKQKFAKEPTLKVEIFQGIPKTGKMEIVVQKCVEAGANGITPVFMARTVVVNKGSFDKKIIRWQKVASESVKQCKRGIIPKVKDPIKFDQMIKKLNEFDLILFPYENEGNVTIKDILRNLANKSEIPKTVAIVIGPEGGFADQEADTLVNAGAKSVSLGKTILRTETAGLVALAMTMYELEL